MDGKTTTRPRSAECMRCRSVMVLRGRRGPAPSLCGDCRADVGSTCRHKVVCEKCGRTVWKSRPGRFCSSACHNELLKKMAHTRPCKECGREFRCKDSDATNGRSYCSDLCRRAAWGQDDTLECAICKTRFRRRRNHKAKNLVCSKQCGGKLRSLKAAKALSVRKAKRFVARLQRQFKKRLRSLVLFEKRGALRPCLRCGKPFRNGKDRLCSVECRKESRKFNRKAGKRKRRAGTHIDRCKIRGLPWDASITAHFIHQRDGWTCMLCGQQTQPDSRLRAPTIGHIVPLSNPLNFSHGHVENNTYTNCASCNGRQGNAVMIDAHQLYTDPRRSYMEHVEKLGYPLAKNRQSPPAPTPPLREFPAN